MRLFGLLAVLLSVVLSSNAYAGKMRFGEEDNLHKLQDIEMVDQDGNALSLGYRTTTQFFILGTSIKDKGYILRIKGSDEYYQLDDASIKELQHKGDLPKQMPFYHLSYMDYALGYSLWIFIALSLLYYGVKKMFQKPKEDPEQPSNKLVS